MRQHYLSSRFGTQNRIGQTPLRQFLVMLDIMFERRQLGNDALALFNPLSVLLTVNSASYVIDGRGLNEQDLALITQQGLQNTVHRSYQYDRPSFSDGDMSE